MSEISERSDDGKGVLLMVSQEFGVVERAKFHEKSEVAQSSIGHKICKTGDLVFNKLKAHLGVFFKTNYNGLVSPDYAVFRAKIDVLFFEFLFRHPVYIREFTIRTTGIVEGLMRLYTSELFSIEVPIPPTEEIGTILSYLKTESENIEQAIKRLEKEIDLIQEYKVTLISETVTGKIDVRDWQWSEDLKEIPAPLEATNSKT